MDQGNLEISKIKALNKVNLEIWNRLPLAEQQYPCMIPSSQNALHAPKRSANMNYFLQFPSTIGFIRFEPHPTDPTKRILLVTKNWPKQLIKFDNLFPQEINLFKDELPTVVYFDLSDVIDKYELLDFSKPNVKSLIFKWKKCLEDVQEYLGSLERKVLDSKNFGQEAELLFPRILGKDHPGIYYSLKGNMSFKFSIDCSDNCAETRIGDMKLLKRLIDDYYEINYY